MSEILIRNLNEQLVSEYEAIFTYLYHSAVVQNEEIRKAMEDFIRHELEHARMLIEYIISLGGEPVFLMPDVDKESDEVQALINSIAAEESAVKKYTMIQEIIDDPKYKEMIGKTIKMEEEHHKILNDLFNKVKEFYKKKQDEK